MTIISAGLLVLLCLALSAFFSSSETALMKLNPEDLDHDTRGKKGPATAAARELIKSSSRLLITILVGNNIVNILAATVVSALAVQLFGSDLGLIVATSFTTVAVLILGEILPKAIAARSPRKVSQLNAIPLYLLHQLFTPIHWLFDRLIDPWIIRMIGDVADQDVKSSESLLRLATQVRQKMRKPDGSPVAIMGSTANASKLSAADIMIPRAEIFALSITKKPKEILDSMLEERYTRVPIYRDGMDQILGLVHLKDLVKFMNHPEETVNSIIKPILRVPERVPILKLLREMQASFIHMALVKDEYGVTQGVLTQEDILEEIVGEIRDEFDIDELMSIQKNPDSTYDVLGRVLIEDFNRETGWEVKAERGDSFSRMVFNSLGRTPKTGDKVEVGHYQVQVIDISGTRITRVRVIPAAKEAS